MDIGKIFDKLINLLLKAKENLKTHLNYCNCKTIKEFKLKRDLIKSKIFIENVEIQLKYIKKLKLAIIMVQKWLIARILFKDCEISLK